MIQNPIFFLKQGQKQKHSDFHFAENVCKEWALIILISNRIQIVSPLGWMEVVLLFLSHLSLPFVVEQLFILLYVWMGLAAEHKKVRTNPWRWWEEFITQEGELKSFIISSSPNARAKTWKLGRWWLLIRANDWNLGA